MTSAIFWDINASNLFLYCVYIYVILNYLVIFFLENGIKFSNFNLKHFFKFQNIVFLI